MTIETQQQTDTTPNPTTPPMVLSQDIFSEIDNELQPQVASDSEVADEEEAEETAIVEIVEAPKAPRKAKAKKVKKASTKKTAKSAKKAKPVKAKKTAAAKEEAEASKPTSGQSGPPINLDFDELNKNEKRIITQFTLTGDREVLTIVALSKQSFPSKKAKEANSWTRNGLRRLIRAGLLEKVERGSYRITVKGRKRVSAALAVA